MGGCWDLRSRSYDDLVTDHAFTPSERRAVYRVISERRDMRRFVTGGVVAEDVLARLLRAAHAAPSVGLMQPWRFIRVTDGPLRERIHQLVDDERGLTAQSLGARAEEFLQLKVEGIRECAELLVVALCDQRDAHIFGRRTLPQMDLASVSCAIQNLWLAARSEGLGMGWVSLFDPQRLAALLDMPADAEPVAILCLGPVPDFPERPALELDGWAFARPLSEFVSANRWDQRAPGPGQPEPVTASTSGPGTCQAAEVSSPVEVTGNEDEGVAADRQHDSRDNDSRDNVLIVHWHDLGRCLGAYGHADVCSPRLDALAAEGILFTRAHSTAPLCSPSRGSLFTGRYPQTNGLIGLAHHGWEYRADVRTLPQILSESGWYSALFGMQHETSFPKRLGFDEFDVSNSYCDYVVDKAEGWLRSATDNLADQPFLLTAGFFETHRPYPRDRYEPADSAEVEPPDYLPDTPDVRADLAAFYGAIATADAAVGRLLDALAETGLDASTWVVFFTDHGPAFPRAKSTLYDAGTGIALIVRPPTGRGVAPGVYDELFSGVDLVPTLLGMLGLEVPADVDGVSHARNLVARDERADSVRDHVYTTKTFHDSFDPIRAIRTKEYSYIENYAERPILDLPLDILESPSGLAVAQSVTGPRPPRELYDLRADPTETNNLLAGDEAAVAAIAADLAERLNDWRERTGDVIPSEFAGTRIASRYTQP